MGCVRGRGLGAVAPRLPRFILWVSLSGILIVVSILGIVFDCYLWLLLQSWGLLMVPVGNMGPIWPGEERRGNWGLWTEGRELGGRASLSEVYAAGRLQWHFACGFDFRYSL